MNQINNKLQPSSELNNELLVVDCEQQRVKLMLDEDEENVNQAEDQEQTNQSNDESHSSTLADNDNDTQVKQLLSPNLSQQQQQQQSCPVRQFFSVDQLVDCGGDDDDDNDDEEEELQDDDDDEDERSSNSVGAYDDELANRTLVVSGTSKPSSVQQAQQSETMQQQQQQQQQQQHSNEDNVKHVCLFGVKIVALLISGKERLCLAQISNTLLKDFSYNEIHNRRVALGITCVQCTPIQLEMLRRAGAMPSSSRRCGMITMREAERLCRSFLAEEQPPELPENFYFTVAHRVNYGCRGRFIPARYISSRAKCIECFHCGEFYSPNKFIFHSHKQPGATDCNPPDSPNINSWRKHINLDWSLEHSQEIKYAWEDVKSLFNGGTRRRATTTSSTTTQSATSVLPTANDDQTATILVANSQPIDKLARTSRGQRAAKSAALVSNSNSSAQRYIEDNTPSSAGADQCERRAIKQQPRAINEQQPAHMSQSERRKLPMGWPSSTNNNNNNNEPMGQRQQQSNSATTITRRPLDSQRRGALSPAPQPAPKRFLSTTNWHTASSARPGHFREPTRCATTPHACHGPTADQRAQAFGVDPRQQQQNFVNKNHHQLETLPMAGEFGPLSSNRSPHAYSSPHVNYGANNQQSISSQASPQASNHFIYSQLYSHLMQSQIAQQQQQQQHHQQQQLTPIEAQLALRHHIWSSLLANLSCNLSTTTSTTTGTTATATNAMSDQTYVSTSQRVAGDHHSLANQLNLSTSNDNNSPLESPLAHGRSGSFNTLNMMPMIYNNQGNPISTPINQHPLTNGLMTDGGLFAATGGDINKDVCK